MKQRSVVRRVSKAPKRSEQVQSKAFVLALLAEHPGVDPVAITERVGDGAIVGIRVGTTSVGVQVLDPWSGKPVTWSDDSGVPFWTKSGGVSTGSYNSRFIGRDELVNSFL